MESVLSLAEMQIGPIEIEPVFLAQLVGFILLFIIFWKVAIPYLSRPYLRGELVNREQRVEEVHNQIDSAIADTQKLHDDYVGRLHNIEVESRERIDAAVREAEAVHDEIIADAKQAAALVIRRTEEELAREQTRQRILLRRKIVQISLDAAEASIQELNTDAVQRKLIGDFIARASTAPGASNG
jgi:F0F1-type ATP synthase membrane subunit b/b'